MGSPRDMRRMGHENLRLSPSSDDELFNQFFDWERFSGESKDADFSPHSQHRRASLSRIITDIPSFMRGLTLETHREYSNMPSYPSDDGLISDYSGQTPPELIQGGSTSPSDHSGSPFLEPVDEAHFHPEASLREVQAQDDEWTYPQTDPSKGVVRGYPHRLQVAEDHARKASEQSSGLKRRRSGNDLERRPRQLVDPLQTADVRKSGACLPCRVSKTRCHESGVCPTCRKAFPDHSHLACSRATPSMFWPVMAKIPDVWSRDPKGEEQLCSGPRFYIKKPKTILVFFSSDPSMPGLRATIQAYQEEGGSEVTSTISKADFPRECMPSHQMLQAWAEDQIRKEYKPDFKHAVQNFLLAYSRDGRGLPKHGLVDKVHRMNCFFRIWKAKTFWCLDPSNKHSTLPLSTQAQLRNIARKAIYSIEHDILKEMDDCIAQQGPPKPQERIAIWASMWQLILMYRELLNAFKSHNERIYAEKSEPAQTIMAHTQTYRWLADAFFPLLTVFYHYQFRTKKSLELSLDWLKSPSYPYMACHSKGIHETTKTLLACRKDHYEKFRFSKSEIDNLLCVFVINHEVKKMNARKRTSKTSSKSKHSHDDDCDEE